MFFENTGDLWSWSSYILTNIVNIRRLTPTLITTKSDDTQPHCIISAHRLKVTVTNWWQFIHPQTPRSQEWKWQFLFILWVTKNVLDCLLISLHLAILWHRDKCRCLWQCHHTKKKPTTNKQHFPTTSWLSFSVNNYNLCRVAKSSNHWLTIRKHFCHLLSLSPRLSLARSLTPLQLLSNDIWPREGTQQPGKLKPLKDSS